ncbi:hypothetical protein ACIRRH_33625 [Kitasatospora sp. NPDC101235]|uniref:hypothetical protein n=1 Tax=Kitasatospora sp. NPDC101235 TaxID=3364101 RepID=UPI0037FF7184
MPPPITFAVHPVLDTVAALSVDRSSRQWLEHAGLVRDDATGLHRTPRTTAPSVTPRLVAEATRLLNAAGHDVLRLYSEAERQQSVTQPATEEPTLTRAPGTIWAHHLTSDLIAGRLVVHAQLSTADGARHLLASFPADGAAAVLSTDGGTGFFGTTEYPDLDAAAAVFGHPLTLPFPLPEPRRAAVSASRSTRYVENAAGIALQDPAAAPHMVAPRAAAGARP